MADVFISYARADIAIAERIAQALNDAGVSVWWDRELAGGAAFHNTIETEILDSRKVVVIWSRTSVDSYWVRDEASLAASHNKLVPISIDDCKIPLGFRSFHVRQVAEIESSLPLILRDLGVSVTETDAAPGKSGPPPASPASHPASAPASSPASASAKASSDADAPMSQIFDDLFGEFMGKKPAGRPGDESGPARGSDLRAELEITLAEAFTGAVKKLDVPMPSACMTCLGTGSRSRTSQPECPTCNGQGRVDQKQGFFHVQRPCPDCSGRGRMIDDPCPTCSGSGRSATTKTLSINVPAGIENGSRIRLGGEGEKSASDGAPGNLYVTVRIKPHDFFQRDGNDLFCKVPLAMTTAVLGGQIDVPNIDGSLTRVKVPEGTATGSHFRLRGKGMPHLRSAEKGDMYIEVNVETPVGLTGRQRDLMQDLQRELPGLATQSEFTSDAADVSCDLTTPLPLAALGGTAKIVTVSGERLSIKIPEGTQSGKVFRVPGRGNATDAGTNGNMYIQIKVETPSALTARQRNLLEAFQKESGQSTSPQSAGFFARVKDFFDNKG